MQANAYNRPTIVYLSKKFSFR